MLAEAPVRGPGVARRVALALADPLVPATQIVVELVAAPRAATARVTLDPPEPETAPEAARGTTARARRGVQATLRHRRALTGRVAPRVDTRVVRQIQGKRTPARLDSAAIVCVVRVLMADQIVREVRVLRAVLIERVVLAPMEIDLADRGQVGDSGATRVRTRVSSGRAVRAQSDPCHAALGGRCRPLTSVRSSSRTSGGPSPSVSKRHLRRGSASSGSTRAR